IPTAGTVRVVARVAQRGDSGPIEIDAWGQDGEALASSAPAPGATATVLAGKAEPVEITPPPGPSGAVVAAAGLLAVGDGRAAEHLVEPMPGADVTTRSPAMDLFYARAIDSAEDLPDNKAADRSRAALERALAAWPKSWEARIGHARVIERRRGAGEGITEALRSLGVTPGARIEPSDVMVAAYAAVTARRAQLLDVAEGAYDAIGRLAPGSTMQAYVDSR